MEYTYQAKLESDSDGGFIVTFPGVPEAITAGENRTEALENAVESLGLALRSLSYAWSAFTNATTV